MNTSKSGYSSRKKVFLTQDDTSFIDSTKSKGNSELFNPTRELSSLKKKYDTVKQENIKKVLYLEWLEGKVYELKSTATSIQTDVKLFEDKSEDLQEEIQKASAELNQELEMKKIYEHMLFRNKTEGTHLDIRVNKFSQNLKSARLQLDSENKKARKSNELRFNGKIMLKELKEALEEDAKKQFAHIYMLETNISHRKEMMKRYDERTKRQAEIIELAARHDREAHEKSIREQIKINQLLYDILFEKEKKLKTAGKDIEQAFQNIKTKTGLVDPEEIVKKFTSRDNAHNRLIDSVEKAESTMEDLRKQYHELRDQLKNLILMSKVKENQSNNDSNEDILEATKNLEKVAEQKRKTGLVYKDVNKWTVRLCEKIDVEGLLGIEENMRVIYEKVFGLVHTAKNNLNEFEKNLKAHEMKKTNELVKQIYKEHPSPVRIQIIG